MLQLRQKFIGSIILAQLGACSSAPIASSPPPISAPEKVPVLALPHPDGYRSNDLEALFQISDVPPEPNSCFETQHQLAKKILHTFELERGVAELVAEQPTIQHWCFYRRFQKLETELREMEGILKKQQHVIDAFNDILPLARAFQSEFKDSRYLRWAIQTYRRISPQVFFRSVELTPETTQNLVLIETPFTDWKSPTPEGSVLEKYGLKAVDDRTPASNPEAGIPLIEPGTPAQELERLPAAEGSVENQDSAPVEAITSSPAPTPNPTPTP